MLLFRMLMDLDTARCTGPRDLEPGMRRASETDSSSRWIWRISLFSMGRALRSKERAFLMGSPAVRAALAESMASWGAAIMRVVAMARVAAAARRRSDSVTSRCWEG